MRLTPSATNFKVIIEAWRGMYEGIILACWLTAFDRHGVEGSFGREWMMGSSG